MTQPTSVNATFDTSLIDLNTSFSTTESDPSDADAQQSSLDKTPVLQQAPLSNEDTPKQSQATPSLSSDTMVPPPKPSTPLQHLPTQDAYDQWAEVYDTDGNMLQAIDDVELSTLLPDFLTKVLSPNSSPSLDLLDLGCGTGRNTAKLLSHSWPQDRQVSITSLDFSRGMLDVAAKKLTPLTLANAKLELRLEQADCFPTVSNPSASPFPAVSSLAVKDAVISTLVLEHVPLKPYFTTLSSLLKPGGYALVTNMHSEMGRISQAGFINAQGIKVRGQSFAHTPQESAEEARRAGFEVLEQKERRMEKGDVESGSVSERGWKWVGVYVWYGLLLRKNA